MVRAGFMEKIMRKTDHTSNFGHGTFEDRTLEDIELDAVTGGIYTDASHWVPPTSRDEMILTGLLQAANSLSR
jgi:hypothetical protein